jgi:hypothetical protein
MRRTPLRLSQAKMFAHPGVLYALTYILPLKNQLSGRSDPELVDWISGWPPAARTVFSAFIAAHLVGRKGYLGLMVSQRILSDVLQQKGSTPAGITTVKNGLKWLESNGLVCSRAIHPEIYSRPNSVYNIGTDADPVWRNKQIKIYVLTDLGRGICEGKTYSDLHRQKMATDGSYLEEKINFIPELSEHHKMFDSNKRPGVEGKTTFAVPPSNAPLPSPQASSQEKSHTCEEGAHKQRQPGNQSASQPSYSRSSTTSSNREANIDRSPNRGVTRWPEPQVVPKGTANTWKLRRRLILRDVWNHLKAYDSVKADALFARAVRETASRSVTPWSRCLDDVLRSADSMTFRERSKAVKYKILPLLETPKPNFTGILPALIVSPAAPAAPGDPRDVQPPPPVVEMVDVSSLQTVIDSCKSPELRARLERMVESGMITTGESEDE